MYAVKNVPRYFWIVILAAAIGIRITYFVQSASSPIVTAHRWEQSDMNFFDLWDRSIVNS